ncbi:hypothetical protein TNIN_35561 [Trichonephila inaurata madagascariensis]|uniref:Uncharacterized protein n=1 Tax=Trichonephila inaurata madagascariensis TaxID=2747483 RepID=A0A8X7CAJ8_9ARAC|nr:hypothetical protein TNIN_35561 [Trichonephila inaurata madagascariensis]
MHKKGQVWKMVNMLIACGSCNFSIAYVNVVIVHEDVGIHFFSRQLRDGIREKVSESQKESSADRNLTSIVCSAWSGCDEKADG